MNILYHATAGVVFELAMPSKGLNFLLSIAPDLVLLPNELRLWKTKTRFNSELVSEPIMVSYFFVHSIWISLLLFLFNWQLGLVHLFHIVSDWFTHTGRFAARPFFPLHNYRITFGKEILK